MRKTVATTTEFLHTWDSRVNFLMAGECVPFSFEFPSTEDIVERLVAEEATTGISGQLRNTGDRENAMESFRGMSCDDLMASSFQFRYPDVTTLDRPGDIFAGFTEQVLVPWKLYLLDHGFTWDRCYALARVSGPNTCTGYHMDRSNVLFWNVRGRKVFHGFREPDRWVPLARANDGREAQIMPENLTEEDVLSYEVGDNTLLSNHTGSTRPSSPLASTLHTAACGTTTASAARCSISTIRWTASPTRRGIPRPSSAVFYESLAGH